MRYLAILIALCLIPTMAFAAVAFVDDFNSYSDGDLNGNNGGSGWGTAWSGSATYDVQGTTVYEGAKAIIQQAGGTISREPTASPTGTGIFYVAMRHSSNSAARMSFYYLNGAGNAGIGVDLNSAGNIVSLQGSTIGTYAANTWYVFRITADFTGSTYTVASSTDAYGSAGTFSAESAAQSFVGSGTLTQVQFDVDNQGGASAYWDYISETSPFTSSASSFGTFNSFWW